MSESVKPEPPIRSPISKPAVPSAVLTRGTERRADRIILYATVAVTGAAVMMIELLGTRIIGPYYGVSLYVWSALISVTMIALAIGYFIGGRVADRASGFRLSHAIAIAALFTALVPVISRPLLELTDPLGVRAGAFCSGLILFTPPLAFLAMVGPWIIRLSAHRLDGIGAASGSVYAVSTLGSVIATLGLGFYLLPLVGSRAIIYGVSVSLFVLAIAFALFEIRRLGLGYRGFSGIATVLIAAVVLIAAPGASGQTDSRFNVLYDSESVYGRVRVVDDMKMRIRWMLADSSTISGEDLDTGYSVLGYQSVVSKLPYFRPGARNALLIGLGGGHLVNQFGRKGIVTDAIEIDPVVAAAAGEYFKFRASGRLVVGDARFEVRRLDGKYDFIVHDCFTGGSEPVHLLSLEMLQDLRSLLKPGGILALNFVGFTRGPNRAAVDSVYRTLARVFPRIQTLVSDPGAEFNDFIFFASDRPVALDSPLAGYRALQWYENHRFEMSSERGVVITDDYNPLESMQVGKAEAYRALLQRRVGSELFLW